MSFFRRKDTLSPAVAATIYRDGMNAYDRGDFAEAIDTLSRLNSSHALSNTLARFYLGQAYHKLGLQCLRDGQHAEAVEHLTKARDINPEAQGLPGHLAAAFAGQRRYDLAAAELERTPDATLDQTSHAIQQAHAIARDGRRDEAIRILVDAIDTAPQRNDARLHLGLLYAASEDFVDAICVFTEAVEFAPLNAELRTRLALCLAAAEDHAEAVEHLAIAQKLRPNDAQLALYLTMALDAAKMTCFKLRFDPTGGDLQQTDDRSLDVLGDLLTSEPEFVEAFLKLPASDIDRDLFGTLLSIIERALDTRPEFADLHYHCARVYERLGRTDEAIAEANNALEINPRYVQALIQLGKLYAERDAHEEARERLSQAVLFGGDYPDVHFMLGELFRADGATDEAISEYRRALDLNQNYQKARTALEALTAA